jgi:glyoxylase-like metal-dependent hydrolase (beta-lactamase superfamily II)
MPPHTITIGNVTVTSVSDGRIEFAPSEFFPSVSSAQWEPYRDQLTPEGDIALNVGSFLLRSEGKTVLVDTGLGGSDAGMTGAVFGLLMDDMRDKGVRAGDVDLVVITHLHRDHVGWNLVRDDGVVRPTFPNARYLVPKADWDIFTRRDGMAAFAYIREQVTPLEDLGVLDLMEGEREITGELTALPAPGHTPGHTCLVVSSQGERGVILGDAAHHPAQAHETDWSPRADTDPDVSRVTRRQLLDRIEQDGAVAASGHFPAPGFGRFVRLEGRRYWQAL